LEDNDFLYAEMGLAVLGCAELCSIHCSVKPFYLMIYPIYWLKLVLRITCQPINVLNTPRTQNVKTK
jgi:hypothetical protein